MSERTAKEAEQANIAAMGEALGRQYSLLWQEVVALHINWQEFTELFGTSDERVTLLNESAGSFFRMLQDALWENTLLRVARLTDKPSTFGKASKANLTVQNLVHLVDDNTLKGNLQILIDETLRKTEFCRDWRNRRIAHRDLAHMLDRTARPLANATRDQVTQALKLLASILNAVSGHYLESETAFIGRPLQGAIALLYVLDDGLRVAKERKKRLERGESSSDDVRRKL